MSSIREVVKSTLQVLKSKEKPVGWPSTHADGSVWRKVKPSGEKGAWAMIKSPSQARASKIIADTVKKIEYSPKETNKNSEPPSIEEKPFTLISEKVQKPKKQTLSSEPNLLNIAPKTERKYLNQNYKPNYFPESIRDLGDFITQVKNTLLDAGLDKRASEFVDLAYKGENNLNSLLNISYKFVSISSESLNKIIRFLISSKVQETKRSLSEAMLGNENAAGEHDVKEPKTSKLTSDSLSGIVVQLQDSELNPDDSLYVERLKESVEKKLIPLAISAKINDALSKLIEKEPSIVLKIIRNYVTESLLNYNAKIKPKPIDDTSLVKRAVLSTKFRNLADSMEESIRNKESPPISRQNVTFRRARIADAMYEDTKQMRDIQSALRGIADEIDLGTFPENLKKIKSKKDIEQILNVSHSLDNHRNNRDTQTQKPLTERLSVWFRKIEPRFISETETNHITVSGNNKIYSHNLTWAYKNGLISKSELEQAKKVQKTIGSYEAEFIESSNLEEVESLKRLMDKFNKIEQCLYARPAKPNTKNPVIIKDKPYELYFKGNPYSNYAERSLAVLRLGLNTFEQVHEAGQYLRTLIAKNKGGGSDPKKIEIRNMERELIGNKIPGFFPTPKPLAQRLIIEADIQPGMDVLEPSAGKGDLAEVISEETGIHPDTIEPIFSLKNILQAKGYTIVADDFLDFVDRRYDRILMNPPFEKGLDIRHVLHAYSLLKPGGKLVAIMSEGPFFRADIKSQEFRKWLTEKRGSSEKLPEGSFTGKDSFRQTGVSTRLVTLTKHTDDILYHKNMSGGISRTFVDNYQPELNVSNRGVASNSNDWTLKLPTDGDKLEDWPVRFKTKTEAIDQGIRSKRLIQKYFSEPEEYGKIVKPADPNVRSEAMKGNQNAVGEHIVEVGIQGILDERNAIPPQSNTTLIKETVKSVKQKSFNSVSEILDDREKNKEFKDANTRVEGSKKERAALSKLLSYADISNMDFVTAERVVKKDRVITPFNARERKEKGESAGLTYLKAKIYEAIASKPADSPFAREQYVKNLEKIMAPIFNAKTINEIQSYSLNFVEISPYDLSNKFGEVMNSLKSKLNGITENEKNILKEEYQKLFAEIIPGSEVLVDRILNGKVINSYDFRKEIMVFLKKPSYRFDNDPNLIVHSTVFGDKLINLLRRRTDSGKNIWNNAKLFEPLGEQEAKAQYEKYCNNFLREDKEYIERVKKKYPTFEDYFRKRFQNAIGRREFAEKKYAYAINFKKPHSREEWAKDPKNQVRENNWDWLDKKRSIGTKGSGYEIHGGSPLPKLIRANGRIVKPNEIASDRLTQDWGFKSVQFGNYMDDRTSREHITRFVCALKDLEDALEMDLSKVIHEGNLSMSFGARGIGKAMAHYEPGYRIINLTKKKGDGTFAHEFGHFLDHLATGKEANRGGSHYVSEDFQGSFGDSARVLMNAIRKSPSGKNTNYFISAQKIGSKYWSKPRELFARAFESYVEDKMKAKGMKNNYLVAPNTVGDPDSLTDGELRELAYPQREERIRIYNAFEVFFREMKLQKNWVKPFDSNTQRISLVEENLDTVGDIVKQKKKRKSAVEDQETLL